MVTTFENSLVFFQDLGVFNVVLPFLLVFTLVYAILEKTKIYGTEKSGGGEVSRKNLNAMTAFVSAFFVVASTQLVAAINKIWANTVLLLMLSICFLLLAGSFHSGKDEFFLKEGGWRTFFMIIMFVGIVLIFLDAFGWLAIILDYLLNDFDSKMVSSIVLVIIIVLFMYYVTGGLGKDKPAEKKE